MTREGPDVLAAALHDARIGCEDHRGDDSDQARQAHLDHVAALTEAGYSLIPTGEVERLRAALLDIEELHYDNNGLCAECHWQWPCLSHETAHAALALPAGGPK